MSEDLLSTSYAQLLNHLESWLKANDSWPSPESAFALYVFHSAQEAAPIPALRDRAWPADDKLVHAPSLAAAGYLLASSGGDSIRAALLSGLHRLSGRDAFPADRQSFVYRPVELLGIATGIAALKDESLSKWIKTVLARYHKEHMQDEWASRMQFAAEHLSGIAKGSPNVVDDNSSLPVLALARWQARYLLENGDTRDVDERILRTVALQSQRLMDAAQNALVFQSLRSVIDGYVSSRVEQHWQVGKQQRDAEQLIVTLCRRFHLFATQLKYRYNNRPTVVIEDEYDVQDLMHSVLHFHFDDVRAEQVTPDLGGKSGRMDFLLKSYRIAIETKKTRKSLKQKDVGDELIVDMKRYRTHPDYRTLICLVYDPDGYCDAPAALENDLSGQDGDFRTTVVVCPKGL